ncbi:transposase family protein [Streptomyces cyaneofuscatus]|uniref:transposase family protein n=1 Tax=Streptomyces cyaneofuscatus TaxID=66883 RepID=UPI003828F35B
MEAPSRPAGTEPWASPALPGATHDLTAARSHGSLDALATVGLKCCADKTHQGAGRHNRVPFRGHRLKRRKQRHNSSHAKSRCVGEQALAVLPGCRSGRPARESCAGCPGGKSRADRLGAAALVAQDVIGPGAGPSRSGAP